ncbi:protein twisted gastrulation-like [Musca vetustissima]|uniref:protein twisted gastrulation-like n=1 Tax=Musca vetustissima TaxID=27455 RepID=UPI002AB67556|nr:protein twisted gastrulation-like [Musca vetustissima]
MLVIPWVLLVTILQISLCISAENCNEDICGSVVSKCILTQSCKCDVNDTACYRTCVMCMGKKYFEECCGCVGLCPNNTKVSLSQKSHVEDFEGVPELFDVLVSSPTDELEYNWNIFTFEVDFENTQSNRKKKKPSQQHQGSHVNCTVVYLDNCVSWNKCRQTCRSTGASSYRWFHDGCCECVGSTCINYGVNESRCRHCPEKGDEFDDDDFEEYDFGDYDGNLVDNNI